MFVNGSGGNELSLWRTFHIRFLPNCDSFSQVVSEKKFFRNQPNKNKNCLWRPCLLPDRHEMRNLYRRPSKKASCQISVHLRNRIQRRRLFRNQPIRNKNCLWRPWLLTDQDEMNNLYRRPSVDDSYQSAKQKQEMPVAAMFATGSERNEKSV